MKKLYFIIIILSFTMNTNAQNQNQLQIGVIGSYFSYENNYQWSKTGALPFPLPTISYWRKTKIGNFGLEAEPIIFTYRKENYERHDVMYRKYSQFQLHYSYEDFKFSFANLQTTLVGSLCYRKGGEQVYLAFGGVFDIYEYNSYPDFGISVGVQLRTKSFYHFYLGSEIKYFKYFDSHSSTLFQTNMFIGYEF